VKQRIVVGVDNSAGATAALTWAAYYAAQRGYALEAVFVMGAERTYGPASTHARDIDDEMRIRAVERILERCPGTDCKVRIINAVARGGLARTLREASLGAEVLVIGEADSALHLNLARDLSAPGGSPLVEIDTRGRAHWVTRDPDRVDA
jgi:hypothetical protein